MTTPVVQLFLHARPGWRARRRIVALQRAFRERGAEILITRSVSDRLEIDARATHVCAVGGDGTLRHVVDALYRSGRPLPISAYPAGTVNLRARECRYPRSPHAFVRRVLDGGQRTAHHIALVNGVPLLSCGSVGPDSFAVEAVSPVLKRRFGRAAYLWAFCKLLMHWPRTRMILSWQGERMVCEAVYVAKGHFFAGPWTFAPQAWATDPLLHVVALEQASRGRFLRFAWAIVRGRPLTARDGVRCFSCGELAISGDAGVPLQADGDVVAHLPAVISLRAEPAQFA